MGTYSNVDPEVEAFVCEQLGLTPVPATQVVARDRHAEFLYACATVGASVESFALEIRHLQRTEVREVEEPFREGTQKGSSAMPHKRNPWRCEQLCGLARVLRGNLQAGLEDIALWHERDISHSSVERIVLADSAQLAYYVLVQFRRIVEGMRVHPDRMLENLDSSLRARVQPAGAAGAGRRRPSRATTRTGSCSAPPPARGRSGARSDRVLAEDPEVLATLSPRTSRRMLRAPPCPRPRRPRGGRPGRPDAASVTGIALPHTYTGKVRDLYDVDHERMLIVASDRISVFDVVLDDLVPDKGRALTALSTFWFEETAGLAPNHLISSDPTDFPETAGPDVAGRAMLVRATQPVRLECIGRGYLFGSAWSEYEHRARSTGGRCRPGCGRPSAFPSPSSPPRPRRSPAMTSRSPTPPPPRSWAPRCSSGFATSPSRVYEYGAALAESRGLILADTKLEFGTSAASSS